MIDVKYISCAVLLSISATAAYGQMPPPMAIPPAHMQNPDPISDNGVHIGPPLTPSTVMEPPGVTGGNRGQGITSNAGTAVNGNAGASTAGNGNGNGNSGASTSGNGNVVSGAGGASGNPESSE